MTISKSKRVSKAQWLDTALEVLETEGVDGVRVEKLARRLGIAKSGFYWHFKDRQELLQEMLNYWAHEYTAVISENPELNQGNPRQRLEKVMRMIQEYGLNRLEIVIRVWAQSDPMAAKVMNNTYKVRHDFIGHLFKEMGFRGDEVEMRTQLFLGYYTMEYSMYGKQTKAKKEKLLKLRHAFFTRK
ncbi:TetR/AcrR family transcriptional regulator [Kaarinaea lacus]